MTSNKKFSSLILILKFLVIVFFLIFSFYFFISYFFILLQKPKEVVFLGSEAPEVKEMLLKKTKENSLLSFYQKKEIDNLSLQQVSIKVIPPYKIKFFIKKREPIAYFMNNGDFIAIDKNKFFFAITESQTKKLPQMILAEDRESFSKGKRANEILALLAELTKKNYKISLISLASFLNTTIILEPYKTPVYLGYENFIKRLEKLDYILQRLGKNIKNIKIIDIRYKNKVVLEYK